MCSCHYKIHWSVISLVVSIVCLIFYTAAVATPNWAYKGGVIPINTGLLQACSSVNRTCYDTHDYFADHWQKNTIMASAVVNMFAVIGMWLFFTLGVFFLCGLFEEKSLATLAIIVAYVSALLALVGTVMFAVSIQSLDYTLSWSFVLAILGFNLDIVAGVLMCVGRNYSRKRKTKEMKRQQKIDRKIGLSGTDNPGIEDEEDDVEDVPMEDYDATRTKGVWSTRSVSHPK